MQTKIMKNYVKITRNVPDFIAFLKWLESEHRYVTADVIIDVVNTPSKWQDEYDEYREVEYAD